jgi:capsular polysaccharide biosynthesis protein
MQEEISLREILETIWNGKILIAEITVIAVIIAAIFSLWVIAPTYEATSTVRIVNNTEGSEGMLNSFVESAKSDVSINRIVEKLKLDRSEHSLNSIRKAIQIQAVEGTSMIRIKVTGEDPEMITNVANTLVFDLGARMEISDRSVEIVNDRNPLLNLDDSMAVNEIELAEVQEQLANTPEKLTTRQSLSDAPYLQSVVEGSENMNGREAGSLSFTSEEVNPLYTSLKSRFSDVTIALSKQAEERRIIEASIHRNEETIQQLENQMNDERLRTVNSERMLNGFKAVFISPAFEPNQPVGPNKTLNVAIAFVVGLMLSIMIVFVRHYWHNSSTSVSSTGNEMSM